MADKVYSDLTTKNKKRKLHKQTKQGEISTAKLVQLLVRKQRNVKKIQTSPGAQMYNTYKKTMTRCACQSNSM